MTRDDAAQRHADATRLFNAQHATPAAPEPPDTATASTLVDAAYQDLLGLSGDFPEATERKGYWIDQLTCGRLAPDAFAEEFLFQASQVAGKLSASAQAYNQAAVAATASTASAVTEGLASTDLAPLPSDLLENALTQLREAAASAGRSAAPEAAGAQPIAQPPAAALTPDKGPSFSLTQAELDDTLTATGADNQPTPRVGVADGSEARVSPGEGFDGVVEVITREAYGSGVLMPGGQAVLTARHVVEGSSHVTVRGETPAGLVDLATTGASLHPDERPDANNDLALVWLSERAPESMPRHGLYRDSDELGQAFPFAGYGRPGDASGNATTYTPPTRRAADNRFDITLDELAANLNLSWTATPGSQLLIDFDNGRPEQDAFGRLLGLEGTGVPNEGFITPGDSGGPAFLDGKVAGIASYGVRLSGRGIQPDIDTDLNSSAGEIGAFQRVSHYQQWIDQRLRDEAPQAPTRPAEVNQVLTPAQQEAGMAYFLIELNGQIPNDGSRYSLDVATRDGTATAFDDYLPVDTTLVFYPGGRTSLAVGVELLEDRQANGSEAFFLDVSNPKGATLAGDADSITAVRTLLSDDALIA